LILLKLGGSAGTTKELELRGIAGVTKAPELGGSIGATRAGGGTGRFGRGGKTPGTIAPPAGVPIGTGPLIFPGPGTTRVGARTATAVDELGVMVAVPAAEEFALGCVWSATVFLFEP
jgi:hypothetical protein